MKKRGAGLEPGCAAAAAVEENSFRRSIPFLALQLGGTLLILALVPGNALKAAALLGWWALTFGRMSRAETVLFIGGAALFAVLDVLTVRRGAFVFSHSDALGLPWWEFAMWGFVLLHARRMTGGAAERGRGALILAAVLAAVFAAAFALAPEAQSRLLLTSAVLAVALVGFHERGDLRRAGYMVAFGAAVEFAGVWSGQWSYPAEPFAGVPLWFAPMWAAVGLFSRRLAEPLIEMAVAAGQSGQGGKLMRTRRPIAINNSLCHGICNYSCRLCAVNKPGYSGPKEHQPWAVTARLIERAEAAARAGIHVRYIANAGDGEPTLHPEFCQRMCMFGKMLREWDAPVPPPEVSVVTNGARLLLPGILEAFVENRLSLIVSFPTPEPGAYGAVMMGRPECGAELLARVVPGIEAAMKLAAEGRLARLYFHVSPPEREVVRRDFPKTVEFLTARARAAGLGEVGLVLFPATSNRTGLIRNRLAGTDMYRDLFKRYDGAVVNGVTVRLKLVLERFFADAGEIADLVRAFRFPCLWNANLFIAAGGDSICCNDQAVRNPRGNVLTHSLAELMQAKEDHLPGRTCAGCNQRPERMQGSVAACVFALAARARLALAQWGTGERRRKEAGDVVTAEEGRPVVEGAGAHGARPAALRGAGNRLLTASRPRASLTQHLRALEAKVLAGAELPERFEFGGGQYTIRAANDLESRKKAYQLVYTLYLEKEYARPNASRMWLSIFDALPETTTLLVERTDTGAAVGALTVVFDSAAGLPADGVYKGELDALRASGRKIAEVISLAVAEEAQAGSQILVKLFNFAYFIARGARGATDFVVTVNPRHVRFYERLMLFAEAGPERSYGKVGGAPALLLRLDFDVAERQREAAVAEAPASTAHRLPPTTHQRSIYGQFRAVREEPATVAALEKHLRPMSEQELGYFFVAETDLLAEAAPAQRAFIQEQYLAYELTEGLRLEA